jgi:hypothetical protein
MRGRARRPPARPRGALARGIDPTRPRSATRRARAAVAPLAAGACLALASLAAAWAVSRPQKTCPDCAERIPAKAEDCPHCGHRFPLARGWKRVPRVRGEDQGSYWRPPAGTETFPTERAGSTRRRACSASSGGSRSTGRRSSRMSPRCRSSSRCARSATAVSSPASTPGRLAARAPAVLRRDASVVAGVPTSRGRARSPGALRAAGRVGRRWRLLPGGRVAVRRPRRRARRREG